MLEGSDAVKTQTPPAAPIKRAQPVVSGTGNHWILLYVDVLTRNLEEQWS